MLLDKQKELELLVKIKNIAAFDKMSEKELIKEADNCFIEDYTYYNLTKKSNFNEAINRLLKLSISRNLQKLLDLLLTNIFDRYNSKFNYVDINSATARILPNSILYNSIDIDIDYLVYMAAEQNKSDCLKIFINHGLNIKKVSDNHPDNPIIHIAASYGNIHMAEFALNAGISINLKNNNNETPLYLAVKNNKDEMVEFLIKNGALNKEILDEYNNFGNLLYYPTRAGNLEMLKLLADNGIFIREDLRMLTNDREILRFIHAKNGVHVKNVELTKESFLANKYIMRDELDNLFRLERNGFNLVFINVDGEPGICIAAKYGSINVTRYFANRFHNNKDLKDSINGRNALHYAAMHSDSIQFVSIFINKNFDINSLDLDNNTPLNLAILSNIHPIDIYLNKGSNINLVNKKQQTPLHLAVLSNNYSAFKSLLEYGADMNKQDADGNTPLHYIAKYTYDDNWFREFLFNKSDIINKNVLKIDYAKENKDGFSPLYYAVKNNKYKLVELLIKQGVKVDEKTKYATTDSRMIKILGL